MIILGEPDIEEIAANLSKITGSKIEIIETSEFFGDNDDDIDESDPYFGKPMYEAYVVDANGDEIEDTRTGRYCDLLSVIDEVVAFASN